MDIKRRVEKLEHQTENGLPGEPPEWALEQARRMCSEPLHPVYRMFKELAEEKGEEFIPDETVPTEHPNYIADPEERERRAREYAWEIAAKPKTETPADRMFEELAKEDGIDRS